MEKMTRRQWLTLAGSMAPAVAGICLGFPYDACAGLFSKGKSLGSVKGKIFKNDAPSSPWQWSAPARFYQTLGQKRVMCSTCPNRCVLSPGDRSVCRSRVNIDGTLYSLAYGNPCAVNVDPMEKKPLFHFKAGTSVFSIACTGCSFRCLNCQNWEISQVKPEDVRARTLFPDQVVEKAVETQSPSIAYTYSEATTFYEYMTDTAQKAKEKGLSNIYISNGYINPEPLDYLCRVIDAANVNLKAFSDPVYQALNGGRLKPVLNTFETLHEKGVHFEITNLVVPGYTDDPAMMEAMCQWILDRLGPDHPLHFLRFFPQYRLNRLPPTPVDTLTRFRQKAMDMGIRYVYAGNVPGHEGNHTYCHNCGKKIVERKGYAAPVVHIRDSRCEFCATKIPGVWG